MWVIIWNVCFGIVYSLDVVNVNKIVILSNGCFIMMILCDCEIKIDFDLVFSRIE